MLISIVVVIIGVLLITIFFLQKTLQKERSQTKKERKVLDTMLDLLSEGVVLLEGEERVLRMNVAAARFLQTSSKTIPEDTEVGIKARALLTICAENNVAGSDSVCPEGKEKRYLDLIVVPYEGKMLLVIEDRSSRHKVLELGRSFVANASHELKTPITIIRGFAETLLDAKELPQEMLEEILEKIVRNCKRMDSLVRNLLTLSDMENLPIVNKQPCDLGDLVRESKKALEALHSPAEMEIDQEEDIFVDADRSVLELALMNLLDNAAKYSKGIPKIAVELKQTGGKAIVKVRDRGIGIPPSDLEHIFDRFYTVDKARSRKLGGAGLGLSLVKTIIEKHEGSLIAESIPGEGSTFTFSLPCRKRT